MINLGKDVDNIINDYKHQLEYTEKYNLVMKELLETVNYSIFESIGYSFLIFKEKFDLTYWYYNNFVFHFKRKILTKI